MVVLVVVASVGVVMVVFVFGGASVGVVVVVDAMVRILERPSLEEEENKDVVRPATPARRFVLVVATEDSKDKMMKD